MFIFTPANAEFLLYSSVGVGSEEGKTGVTGAGTWVCEVGGVGASVKGEEEIGRIIVLVYECIYCITCEFFYVFVGLTGAETWVCDVGSVGGSMKGEAKIDRDIVYVYEYI